MQILTAQVATDSKSCPRTLRKRFKTIYSRSTANFSRIFWQNCTGGLLNHSDFFEKIANNVLIYCGDIQGISKDRIHLSTKEEVVSDVILCGTGWVPSLQFLSDEQRRRFGLPHPLVDVTAEEKSHWEELEATADVEVIATFPQLANPPAHYETPATSTPYRLYRHIVPLMKPENSGIDRSIVFIGHVGVGNYFPVVECQAMWATAYIDGKLNLPSIEAQEKDVALFTTWCRRRYLSNGHEGNNMTFELIGYTDMLLADMGLCSHRKGWFKDLFAPCWARDFGGLKAEFIEKYGYHEAITSQ